MRKYRLILLSALLLGMSTLTVIDAAAQDKRRIKYQTPAENTKYVQQHVIDAGDIQGHQVRIVEIKKTIPKDALAFEGISVVEEWNRGYSDYVDGNGRNWGYTTFVLENGDKVFARWDGNAQTVIDSGGAKKSSGTSTSILTGGTGKFQKIRGTMRGSYTFDPGKGINTGHSEGEYWMSE